MLNVIDQGRKRSDLVLHTYHENYDEIISFRFLHRYNASLEMYIKYCTE